MKKIWFIDIDGKLSGPYSVAQLKNISHITPDTLVWREGFERSIPIRLVPELKELFEDAEPLNPESDENGVALSAAGASADELAIDMGSTPPFWLLALLVALVLLLLLGMFRN
jgi:hypothetical protein